MGREGDVIEAYLSVQCLLRWPGPEPELLDVVAENAEEGKGKKKHFASFCHR